MDAVHELTESELAEILPGTWRIAATNFPLWLSGDGRQPRYTYTLASPSPLSVTDEVTYLTPDGETQTITGRSTFRRGEFVRRGSGLKMFSVSRWYVGGSDEQRTLLVLRIDKTLSTPAGLEIIVREEADYPNLRRTVASTTEELGLSPEDFASLGWLRA